MPSLAQINHYRTKPWGWALRLIILLACCGFIYTEVQGRWTFSWSVMSDQWPVIGCVLLLMPVNWALEVARWKISLDTIQSTSWSAASRQVLGGLALNWVVPFTGGDLVARLLPSENKKQTALLIYYNRMVMLLITVLFGAYGVYRYSAHLLAERLWVFGVLGGCLVVFGFLLRKLLRVDAVSGTFIFRLLGFSFLRYAVFVVQFVILLAAFVPTLSFGWILAGVGWVFFFRSVVPSLFGNLGVREASALIFFEPLLSEPSIVLIPSVLIWIINTVVPSGAGLVYLLKK